MTTGTKMRTTTKTSRTLRAFAFSLGALMVVGCSPEGGPAPADPGAAVSFPEGWRFPAEAEAVTGVNGAVSTTDAYASEIGLQVLRDGGNAVDAAIATQFALAVVNPEAGNIGGGGFMVVRLSDGESAALDFRERAPLAATRDMYLDPEGNLTDRSVVGHLAVGVPGSVMGMWEAHQRYGTLAWERLLEPAIELARGFEVRERFANSIAASEEGIRTFETTAETFLPGDSLPRIGQTFRQPELAATLERIRDGGPDGFYRGPTADLIVAEMERGGGIITHEDLERYTATWREPVAFDYRGYTVLSMPPSSSGGITLAQMSGMLESFDLEALGYHTPEAIHRMAESWKRAYADRNHYLADTDYVEVPVAPLLDSAYLAERAGTILPDSAISSTEIHPGLDPAPEEGENTTHFSIVDSAGNAVAVTTTINSWFGSKVTVAGAGFVLNNEMDDFAAKPGTPNQFDLVQGEANAIEPGKRMLSAMTPTVVLDPDGELFLVTGTPGGSTIITTVFQTISNVVDYGMDVVAAVNAPRVHHQHLPDQIYYENGGLTPEVVAALEAMGHTLVQRDGISGDVQMIRVLPGGVLSAWADPRRGGTAVAY